LEWVPPRQEVGHGFGLLRLVLGYAEPGFCSGIKNESGIKLCLGRWFKFLGVAQEAYVHGQVQEVSEGFSGGLVIWSVYHEIIHVYVNLDRRAPIGAVEGEAIPLPWDVTVVG
jgi:hypothetical protein